MALPALWAGGEPARIVDMLLDALLSMLRLTFASALVTDAESGIPTETIRIADRLNATSEAEVVAAAIRSPLGGTPATLPTRLAIGELELTLAFVPLGLDGEIGTVIVASQRTDFPTQTERLLLGLAANQAALGLQQAALLRAQKRVADEALRDLHVEMTRAAQVATLGELAASIAHEVNQPLSGIVTNASTCLRMLGSDPPNVDGARETARRTLRDGKRAAEVIARVRGLFGKKDFSAEPVDLNDATREVIALTSSELRRNHVTLQSQLADHLPLVVADRIELQQVILNLLRNASDAVAGVDDRSRGVIVRTERDGEARVRVTVQDTGIGIGRDRAERLFDAFYTTKSDGMGVGLSISRSIVHRHRGEIWAAPNDDGPGSTFGFWIPCRPDAGPP
jgi:C4-dicarboxylate-specific signal transduction histidine kinase